MQVNEDNLRPQVLGLGQGFITPTRRPRMKCSNSSSGSVPAKAHNLADGR